MNRRHFALASLPAAFFSGCRSETNPSREATLFHNKAVRSAVADLQEAINILDERLTGFGPENWRDALSSVQTASIRLHSDMDELKHSLGYAEPAEPDDRPSNS